MSARWSKKAIMDDVKMARKLARDAGASESDRGLVGALFLAVREARGSSLQAHNDLAKELGIELDEEDDLDRETILARTREIEAERLKFKKH
jgi:hypothetical protein